MMIVQEDYLTKCLDSGVYQTLVVVRISEHEFRYCHEIRLWSETHIEELRANEKKRARDFIMFLIRSKLFPES